MTSGDEFFSKCLEEWNVRGVCQIDPDTHASVCWQLQIQFNQFAPLPQRSFGGFNHLYHAKASQAVSLRPDFAFDAFDKVSSLTLQGFSVIETRRIHVARSIADQQF